MGRRHDNLVWAASLGLAAAGGYLIPSITAGVPLVRPLFGVRDRLARSPGAALTFDDGPHPEGTPAVLELLAQAHARATFFLAGEQVEQRPALAAEIVAAGHEVALHCHRHRSLLRLAPWQVRDDLQRATAVIGEAAGREPRFYRPPYGVLNSAALTIARHAGWETVLWRREGHDWEALLEPLQWLHLDHTIARGAIVIGIALMIGGLIWAAVALFGRIPTPDSRVPDFNT